MNFVEYLTSIAPEGETILIVRQKPTGGLHNDGAIKCVWPAMLPQKYNPKTVGAWYANTASFIVDRFQDGKVSAAASYCERVAFLVLDDVGTKSNVPPLEPTWKIETSPGNFQWGYTFALDDQPTKGEFSAAIVAIAEAGFTDAGAINPVRNFRIPSSVNLKPDKNNFMSVLTEFHPEREFSLKQICDALGVVPHTADTATFARVQLDDDGNDDVLAWMQGRGEIVEKANAEGWVGVVCPNSADHSDGNPMGRYQPSNRAYVCFHSHCGDWNSERFLKWVADEGGPQHRHGLRDDLIAKRMETALARIKPTKEYPDEAKRVIEEVERKEMGRIEKAEWYKRFAYIQTDDTYFDLIDRREVSRGTFNAIFRHISCQSIHSTRRVEASVCFDENRQAMGAPSLVGLTYAAGDDVLVAKDGLVYANRWRDARPAYAPGDITPWIDHCRTLVEEPAELEHLWDMMAFKVQNPRIKINHAVLHGGDEGSGKDTFWAPFIWSVCGPDLRNRGLVDNDSVSSAWGYHLESEVLIINELKEPDARERRALANKLKPIIAAPPDTLPINRKGLHPYDMVNRMFVLAFSNDPVPISLASQDRRWFCIWSSAPRMNPAAAAKLWKWYENGGFAAIGHWLKTRDVSKFNPAEPPMMTEFKQNLVENSMSTAESYLVDLMRRREKDFARGVIGSPFHTLCSNLAAASPSGVKVPQPALFHALKEAGWVDMGRIGSADFQTKKQIFCAPGMATLSKSDLRRMVEAPNATESGKFISIVK
jgi:hypothetical protein